MCFEEKQKPEQVDSQKNPEMREQDGIPVLKVSSTPPTNRFRGSTTIRIFFRKKASGRIRDLAHLDPARPSGCLPGSGNMIITSSNNVEMYSN